MGIGQVGPTQYWVAYCHDRSTNNHDSVPEQLARRGWDVVDVGGAYRLIRMTWGALARRPLCTSSDADVALHVDL
jgi:hypothetical protein